MFINSDTQYFLNCILSGLNIHLFTNDISPDKNTTVFDYQEVKSIGYAPIYINYEDLVFKRDHIEIKKEFELNRQTIVYGYYLTAGDNLLGGERFSDGPYKIYIAGSIKINMKVFLNIK